MQRHTAGRITTPALTFEGYYTAYAVHRESSTFERSNWRVLLRACGFTAERLSTCEIRTNAPNFDPREYDPQNGDEQPAVIVTRASHFAVGWIDTLRIHETADPALLARVDELIGELEGYPLLSDDDHSELEWEETAEYWERCSTRDRVDYITRANDNAGKMSRVEELISC